MVTPAQCRAARGLLDWSRQTLADKAGVSLRTLTYFEGGKRRPVPAVMAAVVAALERAGVEFTEADGVQRRLGARRDLEQPVHMSPPPAVRAGGV